MGRRSTVLLACLLVASTGLLTGCVRDGARDAARGATERFYGAVRSHNGAAACAELSSYTRDQLEKNEMKPCEQAVLGLQLRGSNAAGATVTETSAEVHLAHGDTVFLDETRDGWRVSAAGCRPTTEQEPYECELES
jgi:hypothetical protein